MLDLDQAIREAPFDDVCALDLSELEAIEPPHGYGRD
jgi:hypothetical protein